MILQSSWDDGGAGDLSLASIMLDHPQIKTVFYWPVNWQLYCASRGWKALTDKEANLIAKHFEIGSHTVNHFLLTQLDPEVAKYEVMDSRSKLKERFNQDIEKFCYPRGYANDQIRKFAKKAGYKEARNTKVGFFGSEDPMWTNTTVHVGYDRAEYDGLTWYEYGIKKFAEAKELEKRGEEPIFHLWGHSHELARYPDGTRLLRKFLKAIT